MMPARRGEQPDALEARLLRDPQVQRAFDELAPWYRAVRRRLCRIKNPLRAGWRRCAAPG